MRLDCAGVIFSVNGLLTPCEIGSRPPAALALKFCIPVNFALRDPIQDELSFVANRLCFCAHWQQPEKARAEQRNQVQRARHVFSSCFKDVDQCEIPLSGPGRETKQSGASEFSRNPLQ